MRTISLLPALAVLASAAPAHAANYSLRLTGPATARAGEAVVIQVAAQNPPPAEEWFQGYLAVVVLRQSAIPSCPETGDSAKSIAPGTGGLIPAFALREDIDATGLYSTPVGFTPRAPGPLLVCGYTEGGIGETYARATMTVQVDAAPAPATTPAPSSSPAAPAPVAAARPANVERPRVKRSGRKLTCAAGSWSGSPSGYAYSWLIDGHARRKATSSKLTVTRALRGHKVRCRVTASNDAGEASALSAPLKLR